MGAVLRRGLTSGRPHRAPVSAIDLGSHLAKLDRPSQAKARQRMRREGSGGGQSEMSSARSEPMVRSVYE
jgi:hypothetical protein